MSVTYVCPACRHGALGPGNCPACLKGRKVVKLRPAGAGGAVPLALVGADRLPRLAVPGFPGVESAMNGGFVAGSVTCCYGGAGVGKTTLALILADRIRRVTARPVLYCSTEQTVEQIKGGVALRVGLAESPVLAAYETRVDAVERVLESVRPGFAVVDSLSSLAQAEPIGPITVRLVEVARAQETALLLVLHETKDGDYNAPRLVEHLVDGMVRLARHEETGKLMWTVTGKYRFGPVNVTAWLAQGAEGMIYETDRQSH